MYEKGRIPLESARGVARKPIVVENRRKLWDSGVDAKWILTGEMSNHRFSLLERIGNPYRPYETRWLALKEAGLPVVPTVRKTEHGVIVTDLKVDGSEIYDDHFYPGMSREHPAINPLFLNLTSPRNFTIIEDEVNKHRDRATAKRILTANDSPFALIVHPDSSWEIMMLDLAYVEHEKEPIMQRATRLLESFQPERYHDQNPFKDFCERGKQCQYPEQLFTDFITLTNNNNTAKFLANLKKIRAMLQEVNC
jgi:hypothetical protein